MAIVVGPNPAGQTIKGTDGNDIIFGGGGRDVIRGGDGDDIIFGGANADRLWGGDGNDILFGNGSNDVLRGGDGDDILFGGGGDDRLYGGSGSDHIIGGDGNDVLYGDNPNDGRTLEGFADFFYFDEDDGFNKILDFEQGLDKIVLVEGTEYTINGNFLTYGSTTVQVFKTQLEASDITFGSLPDISFIPNLKSIFAVDEADLVF